MTSKLSNIDIAQAAKMRRITDVAQERLGIPEDALSSYGRYKAKISLDYLSKMNGRKNGKLVLVTAISPTPAGEGKTTTTVGLGDALNLIGKKALICLREPALGPVFGMKGGAAGGGYAQVVPMEDINLHFTGDFAAIALANNLLAALIDNHIHQGNEAGFDVRRVTWRRVVDVNDRSLREITIGLGGTANGYPRQDGFDIVVASEVMAIFCLCTSLDDLKKRLGNIVVGYTREQKPVRASYLQCHGAMTVLLKDALAPNLVQTLENNPAFVHGGPFANIAHGCNSVIATTAALKLANYVITEAGFGADRGAGEGLRQSRAAYQQSPALRRAGDRFHQPLLDRHRGRACASQAPLRHDERRMRARRSLGARRRRGGRARPHRGAQDRDEAERLPPTLCRRHAVVGESADH